MPIAFGMADCLFRRRRETSTSFTTAEVDSFRGNRRPRATGQADFLRRTCRESSSVMATKSRAGAGLPTFGASGSSRASSSCWFFWLGWAVLQHRASAIAGFMITRPSTTDPVAPSVGAAGDASARAPIHVRVQVRAGSNDAMTRLARRWFGACSPRWWPSPWPLIWACSTAGQARCACATPPSGSRLVFPGPGLQLFVLQRFGVTGRAGLSAGLVAGAGAVR